MRLYLSCHTVFHRRTSFCYPIYLCYVSSVLLYRVKLFYYNQKSAIRHFMSDALTRYICPLSTYSTFIIIHVSTDLSIVFLLSLLPFFPILITKSPKISDFWLSGILFSSKQILNFCCCKPSFTFDCEVTVLTIL